jgi:hypothetical protein
MSASTAPYEGRIRGRALRALPALLASALCAPLLIPAAALATPTATSAFTSPGVYGFTVPAGISSISVTVVGAAGGAACLASAGEGASVSATLAVAPGELLQVGVGAPGGTTGCEATSVRGGAGGGGRGGVGVDEGLSGGGGGGASALALSTPSSGFQAESELIVAGGGGGGGQENGNGGDAGTAGSATSYGAFGGGGGGAGTQTGGGAGGNGAPDCIGDGTAESGVPGSFGLGGRGGDFSTEPYGAGAGGGGGGGYYGGGGGGTGCRGGGGGGGSSFVAAAATVTEAATPTTQASGVTIAYAAPTAEASSGSLEFTGTEPQGVASAAQTLTVHNGGEAPLIVSGATLGGANPDDYLLDDGCQAPVAVGSSCRIGVRFAPQAQGASTATLTLQTNAPVAPVPVELSGTGGSLPQGPQGAQGLQGAEGAHGGQGSSGEQGAQGPSGAPGAQGLQGLGGAQGASGIAGSRGANGPQGATGRRGAAGEIRLVSCISTAVGAPGHGASRGPAVRMTCTSQLERDPVSLPTSATASASLARAGQLYATGELTTGRLVLYSRRALVRGSYTLTLRWRSGAVTHTARRQFEVA